MSDKEALPLQTPSRLPPSLLPVFLCSYSVGEVYKVNLISRPGTAGTAEEKRDLVSGGSGLQGPERFCCKTKICRGELSENAF